ncbi:uncharacterized protein BO96DRAFT_408230, partial [Aspergillus niger CBS 101883]|uniref:uncharacterized protein n=1 Tax=Aspergillus lacticoffeatus (strain CBS 101883) TaxID=1450533 RepID=UPI000D7F6A20
MKIHFQLILNAIPMLADRIARAGLTSSYDRSTPSRTIAFYSLETRYPKYPSSLRFFFFFYFIGGTRSIILPTRVIPSTVPHL